MRVFTEAQIAKQLTPELAYRAVAAAFTEAADGSASVNPVIACSGLNEGEIFAVKSGISKRQRIVGLKVGSYWPSNVAAEIARHGSTIFLLNPNTGHPLAVFEASQLNGPRTAAADAVAADALARSDATTLTVIGAGHQAASEVRALCAIRSINRVLIANRTTEGAIALRERLAAELDVRVEAADIEFACRHADILVTVTPSRAPLFESIWVKAGTHVASMGSDQKGKQELPPGLLTRARLFCDLPSQSTVIGEFQHIRADIESGAIVLTAIGDVLSGRAAGRCSRDEITVFDSSGLALQDLFIADSLLRADS